MFVIFFLHKSVFYIMTFVFWLSVRIFGGMNNRYEIAYRLQRDGIGEIQVGWERIYDLTPGALKDLVKSKSFEYDEPLSIAFPEWWKNDKEAYLPSVILNNVFGIIPDYDYKKDFTGIRLVNLATNEVMENFPGDKDETHLLYICKHILTYCKKVLRSWGKEPYREFRYGIEYLRDKWHIENYPDAFQRPDVRIYDIMRFNRLSQKDIMSRAYENIRHKPVKPFFNEYDDDSISLVISTKITDNLIKHFNDRKPQNLVIEREDLGRMFWFLFDKNIFVATYKWLREETDKDYDFHTCAGCIAETIVPAPEIDPLLAKVFANYKG